MQHGGHLFPAVEGHSPGGPHLALDLPHDAHGLPLALPAALLGHLPQALRPPADAHVDLDVAVVEWSGELGGDVSRDVAELDFLVAGWCRR